MVFYDKKKLPFRDVTYCFRIKNLTFKLLEMMYRKKRCQNEKLFSEQMIGKKVYFRNPSEAMLFCIVEKS